MGGGGEEGVQDRGGHFFTLVKSCIKLRAFLNISVRRDPVKFYLLAVSFFFNLCVCNIRLDCEHYLFCSIIVEMGAYVELSK